MKRLLSTATVMATMLLAMASRASHDYPTQIRDKYTLGYCPDCTLCHATNQCGSGTVVTDFGLSLVGFGAKGRDPVSLDQALDTDRAREWDSDGDGVPDVDELVEGTDPSGPSLGRVTAAKYGCAIAPHGAGPRGAVFMLASCLLLHLRRRSRRGRSSDTRLPP